MLVILFLFLTCTPFFTFGERIVLIAPFIPRSHMYSMQPIVEELAKRGHLITVVSSYPPPGKDHVNIRSIVLKDLVPSVETQYYNFKENNLLVHLSLTPVIVKPILQEGYETLMRNKEFLHLLTNREADLVILDAIWQDFALPAIDYLGVPFVYYSSTASPFPWTLNLLGASQEYATVPVSWTDYGGSMTLWQRFVNTLTGEYLVLMYRWYITRFIDRLAEKDFPNMRSSYDVARSAHLCLVNHHPATSWSRPYPSNIISVGALHVRAPYPLPSDFKTFADESKDGFIVFTFGSNAPVSSLPDHTANIFVEVFSQLPQRVIWKWEKENLPGIDQLPKNILISEWLPQQDLIGHKNARLFISHGGLLGIQEALYHGVPILGLPLGRDQPLNLVRAQEEGYGIMIRWEDVNKPLLASSINKLLSNSSFQLTAQKFSKLMHDEIVPARQVAAHWIEHVLRYGNSSYLTALRNAQDRPFYTSYLFDVWLLIIAILLVFFLILLKLNAILCRVIKNLFLKLERTEKIKTN